MIPTTEETATISLKRLFDYQEKIAELEKRVEDKTNHIVKVADALMAYGFTIIVSKDGTGFELVKTTDKMFDPNTVLKP